MDMRYAVPPAIMMPTTTASCVRASPISPERSEFSIVNNVSLGSKAFTSSASAGLQGNYFIQGNKVYGTTDTPADVSGAAPVTLIDNVFHGPANKIAVRLGTSADNAAFLVGNTFVTDLLWPVLPYLKPMNHGTGGSKVASRSRMRSTAILRRMRDWACGRKSPASSGMLRRARRRPR